jgi:hypothetical protein
MKTSCDARPDHTSGQERRCALRRLVSAVPSTPEEAVKYRYGAKVMTRRTCRITAPGPGPGRHGFRRCIRDYGERTCRRRHKVRTVSKRRNWDLVTSLRACSLIGSATGINLRAMSQACRAFRIHLNSDPSASQKGHRIRSGFLPAPPVGGDRLRQPRRPALALPERPERSAGHSQVRILAPQPASPVSAV